MRAVVSGKLVAWLLSPAYSGHCGQHVNAYTRRTGSQLLENPATETDRHPGAMIRRVLRWLLALRGSPNAIALGVAIGMFVAFTPTLGFQMVLAAFLATLLGASRAAAVALVWITNPVTSPPIFVLTYWVGSFFWSGPPIATVRDVLRQTASKITEHDVWALHEQFMAFATIGQDILVPLVIGGVLVGTLFGALSYVITLRTVRRYRRLRQRRRRN